MDEEQSARGERVGVVTGGGSGIGAATARRLARRGFAVAVLDRDEQGSGAIASEIESGGGRAQAFSVDVTDEDAMRTVIDEAREQLGRPCALVTSAGIFHGPDLTDAHEVALDDFMTVLSVNLVGTFLAAKHTLPYLIDGGGAIVTIASTAALRGHGHGAGYTASKGGVDALTRLLAYQYGLRGVRANCVCPGATDTPMTGGIFAGERAEENARRSVPLGTYARPDQIADVAAFLASDEASYLTGQTIAVDGGATIR